MRRFRNYVLVVAVLIMTAVIILITHSHFAQPRFQSRPLFYWLEVYGSSSSSNEERIQASNAVVAIGTNALPFLLKGLQSDSPKWKSVIQKSGNLTNAPFVDFFGQEEREMNAAVRGFKILGDTASPALPALTVLLDQTNNPAYMSRAVSAIGLIGAKGFPILTNALANTNHYGRGTILYRVKFMRHQLGNKTVLVPIRGLTNDPDLNIRGLAKGMLGELEGNSP